MVCGLGVARWVLAAWHPELGRGESPVAGAMGCGVHRPGAPGATPDTGAGRRRDRRLSQRSAALGCRWQPSGPSTGQDGRVRPARLGERGRGDVPGRLIQRHADGVGAHRFDCSPGAGEQLVGPPAEQERAGALVGLGDQRPGLVVACPPGPSAALESVPAVLIRRAAVSLHHSIDGDLRHDRQFHDLGSLLPGRPSRAAAHLRYEHLRPDPTPPRGLLPGTFRHAGHKRSGSATVPRATALTSSCARPVQTSSGTRSIVKTLTSRPPR